MATISLEIMQQDRLVMSVAGALAVANEVALQRGTDPANSLVSITEDSSPAGRVWRINYGPRDYLNCRGGDLIVLIDQNTASVHRVIEGQ